MLPPDSLGRPSVGYGSLALWLGLLLAVGPAGAAPVRPAHQRPNFIHIMLDEWGYYEWSGAGHPLLRTPNIDRLAAQGMRFTQMLAGGNVCAPTRCVLMTGLHTGHATVRANGGGLALRDQDLTVAEILKQAGYATGGFGKWGLGDRGTTGVPERQGFDVFFGYYHQVHAHTYYPLYLLRNSVKIPLPGNTGDFHVGSTFSHQLIYEYALDFIRRHKDRPFYAYLPWTVPHGQWAIPTGDPAWQKYQHAFWDCANQKGLHDAQVYAAMIEMADRQIGRLVQLLEELGIDRNTVIILSGDNGGQPYFKNDRHPDGFFAPNVDPRTGRRFRGSKGNFYEGGLRVPFIVRWTGRIQPGSVSDHLACFTDVLPTLAELAGAPVPDRCDGISLVPTLLGEKHAGRPQAEHPYLYWEDRRSVAVRLGRWKALCNCPPPARLDRWELYDLETDPSEQHDLADRHPDLLARIQAIAAAAHQPVQSGKVLDRSLGFAGHKSP